MKKTIFQRVMSILGLLALTVLFLACLDEPQVLEQQKAKVIITVSDSAARTVLPQASLTDVASYKLLGEKSGAAETVLVESFTDTVTSVTLDPGTWNFTLNAYNGSGENILQGKVQNKQINLTGANQVSFSLSGMKSGTGSIQITLNFPEIADITRISTTGDAGSENFSPNTGGNFVYAKNGIVAGDYFINFELYREDVLRTVVSELVLVRNGLTSSKTITIVEEDLKPLYLTGTVTINPGVSVTIGTELIAVYDGTETVTYQWNKNSSVIADATEAKYTPDSTGSYTVTVSAAGYNTGLSSSAVAVTRPASIVPGTTLQEKLKWLANTAESYSSYVLEVSEDETIPSFSLSYSNMSMGNIVITLKSAGSLRTVSFTGSDAMFTVGRDITLVLDNNIALKRQTNSSSIKKPLVSVYGTLVMNTGSAITGGSVEIFYGTFTMYGGTISDNTVSSYDSFPNCGGGVYVNRGTFTMYGGTISGNGVSSSYSSSYGGGVYMDKGTFTMYGGTISGNTAYSSISPGTGASYSSSYGGGVYVSGGTFIMSGGIISGNTSSATAFSGSGISSFGGGVYVDGGTFIMGGGTISGNTASSSARFSDRRPSSFCSYGGGVCVGDGTFIMSGGTISGNTSFFSSSTSYHSSSSRSYGGGVYVAINATFIKTSGTIYGYTSGNDNSNAVKENYSSTTDTVLTNRGHAAYVDSSPEKRRESTAGPTDNMDSTVAGSARGWE